MATAIQDLRRRQADARAASLKVQPRREELDRIIREKQEAIRAGKRMKEPFAEADERQRITNFQMQQQNVITEVGLELQTVIARSRRLVARRNELERELSYFAPIMGDLEDTRQRLHGYDAAMVNNPRYMGVPQNAYRQYIAFLHRPNDILSELNAVNARLAELGEPEEL